MARASLARTHHYNIPCIEYKTKNLEQAVCFGSVHSHPVQCSVAEAKGSARKTVVLLNWVSEVERDLTPAHFHWVVVIARAAAARTAAPRPWRGRGLGDGSAVAAAAGTLEAMPTLLEC